jgi:hypothetical protein
MSGGRINKKFKQNGVRHIKKSGGMTGERAARRSKKRGRAQETPDDEGKR